MNHIYRLVWNECTRTWVAVAENTRSRGKGSGRAARKAFICALTAAGFSISPAMAELPATTVIPASGKTNAYISANGVPVVNIETANAAGLSHNYYTSYNVQANGLVLNNGNNSQVARQSQLAGQVVANLNLIQEARIILNEVVSNSRSVLAGFTEVLGGKADVIVANPNGITCNGCGFINTDRVTLSSGVANIGGAGNLAGFSVNRGDVLIEGVGANAGTQQIFDIVARSVKIDGKINTLANGSLGITTGNTIWDYATRNVTGAVAGTGAVPVYALDSTALGGMYAGRIRIIATEAGVGVRMLGEAAASADDFTLNSAGKVEIQSALSAARDTTITTSSASGNQDIFINGAAAKLSASRDLALFATSGRINLNEGELYAANNLTLTGNTLSDVSTAAKTRFAGVNNTLNTSGAAAIDGGIWGAGSALSGAFDALAIGTNGATLYAGTTLDLTTVNNLSLANAAVRSAGNMTLAASSGAISTSAGVNQGIQTTAGNLSMTAGNGLTNAGTVTADTGSITARVNGTLDNSGALHAKTTLDIADQNNGRTENITNSGTLLADGSMTVAAQAINNSGAIQATAGTILNATSLLNTGTFIASDTAGSDAIFSLSGAFDSSGTLQSKGALTINATGAWNNSGKLLTLTTGGNAGALIFSGNTLTNSGEIDAAGTVLASASGSSLFTNSGILQGAGSMTLNAGSALNNSGRIIGDNGMTITTGSGNFTLSNSGLLQAGTQMTVGDINHLASSFSNLSGGTLLAPSLNMKAGTVSNAGTVQATDSATVSGTNFTNNTGSTWITSTASGTTSNFNFSSTIDNQGTLQSVGALNAASTGTLTNSGTIKGSGNLALTGSTFTNRGFVDGSGLTTLTATNTSGTTFTNSRQLHSIGAFSLISGGNVANTGTLIGDNTVSLTTGQASFNLDNSGRLQSGAAMTLGGTNHIISLNNQLSGVILSGAALNLTGGSISNTGTVQAASSTTLSGTNFTNNTGSTWITSTSNGAASNFNFSGIFDNQGTLQSAGALNAASTGTLTNSGTIKGSGNLSLTGSTFTNSGFVDGSGLTTLTATNTSGTTFTNSRQLHSIGAFSLVSGGNVANTGTLIGDDTVSLTTGQASFNLDNSGRLQSGAAMTLGGAGHGAVLGNQLSGIVFSNGTLSISGGDLDNQGKIYANTGTSMNVANVINGGAGNSSALILGAMSSGTSTISASGTFDNYGAIHSNDTFTISATGITNRSTGGLSSLTTLDLTARTGNLDNYGALYAGNQLTVSATLGNLTNYASTGTMDSSGSMSLNAGGTFTNNSTINATNDISINASTVRNEIPGGVPARLWGATNWGGTVQTGYTCNGSLCPVVPGDEWWYYRRDGSASQYFAAVIPAVKPQIIAGRNMNISGFSQAFNTGAVLSASSGTLSITGTGSFTNDDLSLLTNHYTETWYTYKNWGLISDTWSYNQGYNLVTSPSTAYSYGAGIFASTLNASGFALYNQSSPWAASPTSRSASGASQSNPNSVSGANNSSASSATGVNGAGGAVVGSKSNVVAGASLSFAGLNLTLPSNPNGYFVPNRDPAAHYLVETNPLFAVGSNFVGSDYMAQRYGYNPDTVIKRLGDSNYEAYLVRQQLIQQTGGNVLKGYGNEAAQMQSLMDQAVSQGKEMGLVFGQALSPSQAASLKQDIVWMEEVVVAGQKVLAPRVYLAQSTRDMISGGAVIAGDNVNLDVTSLTNTGGSISGGDTLKITSKGDITNTSGNISGGNVSLKSTEGSIKNETLTQGSGNDENYKTTIGKTAGIQATGNLELDAKKDIKVLGGDVSAGGDASLSAGGNVTFDTIVDKSTTTSRESLYLGLYNSSTTTTTSNEKNIGSNLASGGKLSIKSGGDTTIAGSNVQADGGLDVDAGGNFNVLARQDKTTTKSTSETSGIGVGGGLVGSETTTTDNFKGSNKGSTIQVGKAEDQETRVAALQELRDKNAALSATTDALLALKAKFKNAVPGSPEAAALKEKFNAGLASYRSQLAESKDLQAKVDAIPSGDLNVKAGKSMVLQGSDLNVAGNADIYAKQGIQILDGLDEERTTTTTTTTTFLKIDGAGNDTNAEAKSDKNADSAAAASGKAGKRQATAQASADASAEASADASSEHNVKLMETSTTTSRSGSKTSVASNLNIGGNLKAKTDGTLTIQGSNVSAGGDASLDAKDIEVLTGRNEEFSDSQTSTASIGFYEQSSADASAGASADASAKAKARGAMSTGASAEANAQASAEANAESTITVGVRTEQSQESSYNLTNTSSTIKVGGSLDIKAQNKALFVGADIESGGDMNIEAKNIENRAAQDISTSTSSSTQNTAGLYIGAEAHASAGAEANANASTTTNPLAGSGAEAGASVGAEASAEASAGLRENYESEKTSERSVTNVTNTFKSGGNFKRTAEDTILDQGTSIEAVGNIEQSARVIKEEAIHDTTSSSTDTQSHDARVGVYAGADASASASANAGADGVESTVEGPDAGASAGLKASYKGSIGGESESTSTAVTSRYKAGGSITSKSTESTTLIGTQFEAGKDISIEAGSLDYQAARNSTTSSSNSNEIDASGKIGLLGKAGVEVEGSYGREGEGEKTSTAQTGSISAAGNISIKTTKGDATLEGTSIEGKGRVELESAGSVNFKAAYDTVESTSNTIDVSANISSSKGESGNGASAAYAQEDATSKTAQVGSLKGGTISVKAANDINLEGTKIKSKGDTSLEAGNNVNLKAAENSEISTGFGASLSGGSSKNDEGSSKSGEAGANASLSINVTSETTSIDSGGTLTIKGKSVTNQEADLSAKKGTQITGKVVNEKAADYEVSVGLDVAGSAESTTEKKKEGSKTTDDIPDNRPKAADVITKKYAAEAPEPSKKSADSTPVDRKADLARLTSGWDKQKENINKGLNKPADPAANKVKPTDKPPVTTPAQKVTNAKPNYMNDTASSSLKKKTKQLDQ
ncbi:MAG: hemagglutinin repeat-containing protein [Gallionella sp.]|nr:hemagglutinin repeat-containing protein [Gallionella sp.]